MTAVKIKPRYCPDYAPPAAVNKNAGDTWVAIIPSKGGRGGPGRGGKIGFVRGNLRQQVKAASNGGPKHVFVLVHFPGAAFPDDMRRFALASLRELPRLDATIAEDAYQATFNK